MQRAGINLRALERKARESEERESFEVIEQSEFVRISGGARITESNELCYFVEVTVYPCPPGPRIDASFLERQCNFVKDLEQMGYCIGCQEGGFMVGESQFDLQNFEEGLRALKLAVSKRFGSGGGD
jgi:hypothetical protein